LNIIKLKGKIESSPDCKIILNKHLGEKKWKRLYKLGNLRCFRNEDNEYVTIGIACRDDADYCLYVGINIEKEIKAIRNIAQFYYTHDYGQVYYNPTTNNLHIVGGDGGYIYSKVKPKMDEYGDIELMDDSNFIEFNAHPETSFINDVEWADEWSPSDEDYIYICDINDVCEFL